MDLSLEIYKKLDYDKLRINWNKNPIKMELFLSFLTVPITRSKDNPGISNGWTELFNDNAKLQIHGGIVNDIEYLDGVKYGHRLQNQYNDNVNPFYLFDVMTKEGKQFFFNYYKEDIDKVLKSYSDKISNLQEQLKDAKDLYAKTQKDLKTII